MTTPGCTTEACDFRDNAEALAEACEDLDPEPVGTGVFEIEDGSGLWEVGAYCLDPPDDLVIALVPGGGSPLLPRRRTI